MVTGEIALELVLTKTSRLADETFDVTFGKISRLAGDVLSSEPSTKVCFESERKKPPETADEAVCTSTQPEDTPEPKSSLACSALLLEAGTVMTTGLMMPGPRRSAPE